MYALGWLITVRVPPRSLGLLLGEGLMLALLVAAFQLETTLFLWLTRSYYPHVPNKHYRLVMEGWVGRKDKAYLCAQEKG